MKLIRNEETRQSNYISLSRKPFTWTYSITDITAGLCKLCKYIRTPHTRKYVKYLTKLVRTSKKPFISLRHAAFGNAICLLPTWLFACQNVFTSRPDIAHRVQSSQSSKVTLKETDILLCVLNWSDLLRYQWNHIFLWKEKTWKVIS